MQKIDVSEAAKVLDLPEEELQEFEVEDFVNPENVLKGYISKRKDHRYGALYITHVNNKVAKQVVYGTPKIHYPFDKLGRWTWPKVKSLNVYTKYDGTNITAFTYRDHNEDLYVTYKTRLTPTVQSGRHGAFREMWFEILKKYPGIPEVVREMNFKHNVPGIALSFELFGSRNFHLINYDVPIDTRLLFGIRQKDASVIDPEELFIISDTDRMPPIPEKQTLKAGHDVNSFYTKLVEEQEAVNQATEFGIEGGEGYIFYVRDENNKVILYKAKPQSILDVHWAISLSRLNIVSAAYKAIENVTDGQEISIEDVKAVLKEDCDSRQVEAYHDRIAAVLEQVKEDYVFRDRVRALYQEAKAATNTTITQDKVAIMRWMSKQFSANRMGYVYFILTKGGID